MGFTFVQGDEIYVKRGERLHAFLITFSFLLFFVYFQSTSIYGGDAGDLVTAAFVRGIPHPPGYPLYTFIGWILTKIPFNSISYRVTLLSSVPAGILLGIFYTFMRKFEISKIISIIGISTLGFSYLFWLYASVPEVFMLHLLFVISLSYISWSYFKKPSEIYLYAFSFFMGLSFSHHHTIIILLPAYLYLFWKNKKFWWRYSSIIKILAWFLLGLIPYIYIPWAAHKLPPISWDNPNSVAGFIKLITRSQYGTFRAHSGFTPLLIDRLFQVKLMWDTFLIDFSRLGVLLAIAGGIRLYFSRRQLYWFCLLGFFLSGPFFFFYAGFPSMTNFHLGTMERFLLTPYLFFVIFIIFGIEVCILILEPIFTHIFPNIKVPITPLFALLPLVLLITNYSKISSLKNDRIPERLAQDILISTPDRAIVFLIDDTSVFSTQYVYFTEGGQKAFRGIKLVQLGVAGSQFYQTILNRLYPEIEWPKSRDTTQFVYDLAKKYDNEFPILSVSKIDIGPEYGWVQYGLLFRLHQVSDTIAVTKYIEENERLFSFYQDPLAGALNTYQHVMLADTERVYANAYREVATTLFLSNHFERANKYLEKSLRLQPESIETQRLFIEVLLKQQMCSEAETRATEFTLKYKYDTQIYFLLSQLYRECLHDPAKANGFEQEYKQRTKQAEQLLREY